MAAAAKRTEAGQYAAVPTTDSDHISSSSAYDAPPSYTVPAATRALLSGDLEDDDFPKFATSLEESELAVRMNFVRKVYSILGVQLALTSIVGAFCMYNQDVKQWTQTNPWALITSWLGTIGSMIALMIYRRSHPVNFYLLGVFTLFESYAVGTVVSFYDSQIVLQAVILTFALFIGLTLFTLQSKWDFNGWAPYLYSALWVVVIGSLLQIFLPYSRAFDFGFSIVIAVLFSAYIIYDTNQIFTRLSPEEYIVAAVELYLDIINLFLAILRILGNSRD